MDCQVFHPSFLLAPFQRQPPINSINHLDSCSVGDVLGIFSGTLSSVDVGSVRGLLTIV